MDKTTNDNIHKEPSLFSRFVTGVLNTVGSFFHTLIFGKNVDRDLQNSIYTIVDEKEREQKIKEQNEPNAAHIEGSETDSEPTRPANEMSRSEQAGPDIPSGPDEEQTPEDAEGQGQQRELSEQEQNEQEYGAHESDGSSERSESESKPDAGRNILGAVKRSVGRFVSLVVDKIGDFFAPRLYTTGSNNSQESTQSENFTGASSANREPSDRNEKEGLQEYMREHNIQCRKLQGLHNEMVYYEVRMPRPAPDDCFGGPNADLVKVLSEQDLSSCTNADEFKKAFDRADDRIYARSFLQEYYKIPSVAPSQEAFILQSANSFVKDDLEVPTSILNAVTQTELYEILDQAYTKRNAEYLGDNLKNVREENGEYFYLVETSGKIFQVPESLMTEPNAKRLTEKIQNCKVVSILASDTQKSKSTLDKPDGPEIPPDYVPFSDEPEIPPDAGPFSEILISPDINEEIVRTLGSMCHEDELNAEPAGLEDNDEPEL